MTFEQEQDGRSDKSPVSASERKGSKRVFVCLSVLGGLLILISLLPLLVVLLAFASALFGGRDTGWGGAAAAGGVGVFVVVCAVATGPLLLLGLGLGYAARQTQLGGDAERDGRTIALAIGWLVGAGAVVALVLLPDSPVRNLLLGLGTISAVYAAIILISVQPKRGTILALLLCVICGSLVARDAAQRAQRAAQRARARAYSSGWKKFGVNVSPDATCDEEVRWLGVGNAWELGPTEIARLTNVTDLTLFSNYERMTIPSELSSLPNVRRLSLDHDRLATMPSGIANFSNLETLELIFLDSDDSPPSSSFDTLPAEIGKLKELKVLFIEGRVTTLPPETGDLTNLKELDLSGNQLAMLPAEIGQLTSLTSLDLRSNQLTTLPVEILQLTSLQSLAIHGNNFTVEEVARLKAQRLPNVSVW